MKRLFARQIGTKERPRGAILAAYARARKGLEGNLENSVAVDALLNAYRQAVETAAAEGLAEAIEIGEEQAAATLEAWELETVRDWRPGMIGLAMAAVVAVVDRQIKAIRAGTLTEAQILGGRNRIGLFAPGVVQREAANQMANVAADAQQAMVMAATAEAGMFSDFVRQAVAAIDERTTPCCLGVHGQVRDLDEWYETPDAPAYAERQERPPFHDYCRTSQVLVHRLVAEDDLTRRMRRAATLEMVLRGRPGYRAPHPADAFTRTRRNGERLMVNYQVK